VAKILVIEDESSVRATIIDLLKIEDHNVLGAENGLIGVGLARKEHPDLIICDVMMPGLDGYGVLNALHQEAATATIPFLFLTAKADKEDLRYGMNLGADDYLTKPFAITELLKAIDSRLSRKVKLNQVYQNKMEELRTNLANSLPHELITPLGVIMMSSEMLLEYPEIASNPAEVTDIARRIHGAGERLNNLTQKFLLFTQLSLISTDPARIEAARAKSTDDTKAVITSMALEKATQMGRKADLELQLQDSSAKICEEWLGKVVEELVDNAFRYSEPGTYVRVVTVPNPKQLILYIIDNGRGISSQYVNEPGAFVQFERQKYEQQGIGLGLSIVKSLIELHNGELKTESVPGQKTIVRVTIPR
jgi:two-component system sensor histidine kinase/response regulator